MIKILVLLDWEIIQNKIKKFIWSRGLPKASIIAISLLPTDRTRGELGNKKITEEPKASW